MKLGSFVTLVAIAWTAFFVADVAHEGIGHGGACLALGGRVAALTTTNEICSIRSRWIDGAGPVAGLIAALLAWTWLRLAPSRAPNTRASLCLVFAFTIFWNVGYLVFSGVADRGDWKFVVQGLATPAVCRGGLVVIGIAFYAMAMRGLGASLGTDFGTADGRRPQIFGLIALLSSSFLAMAGGFFDPRGFAIILTDALPAALSSFGLVWVGFDVQRRLPSLRIATPTSPLWIAIGFLCAAVFVAILGPGLHF